MWIMDGGSLLEPEFPPWKVENASATAQVRIKAACHHSAIPSRDKLEVVALRKLQDQPSKNRARSQLRCFLRHTPARPDLPLGTSTAIARLDRYQSQGVHSGLFEIGLEGIRTLVS